MACNKKCLHILPLISSEEMNKTKCKVRARLVDYLFPMSKVLKIRVGRSGKKKGKKRQKYL